MRVRLLILTLGLIVAMAASTLLPAVAAEGTSESGDSNGRQLLVDPPDCPDWEGIDALFAAKQTEVLAELAKEPVPRDLVLGAVVAGEGEVSTDGPNPLYVAAYAAYKAAQEAALLIETNKQRYDKCQEDAHRDLLRELTETVETDDAENNRIQIENALYPCVPLVALYLPEANGGQLETVRAVVNDAITSSAAAGFDVTSAQTSFDAAVGIMDDGAYRDAFIGFCSAYGRLIGASGGGNSDQIPQTSGSGYVYLCINKYTGQIRHNSDPTVKPPAVDPEALCTLNERPFEVVGWYFAD